jgi:hypothetical protein
VGVVNCAQSQLIIMARSRRARAPTTTATAPTSLTIAAKANNAKGVTGVVNSQLAICKAPRAGSPGLDSDVANRIVYLPTGARS